MIYSMLHKRTFGILGGFLGGQILLILVRAALQFAVKLPELVVVFTLGTVLGVVVESPGIGNIMSFILTLSHARSVQKDPSLVASAGGTKDRVLEVGLASRFQVPSSDATKRALSGNSELILKSHYLATECVNVPNGTACHTMERVMGNDFVAHLLARIAEAVVVGKESIKVSHMLPQFLAKLTLCALFHALVN